VSIGDTPGSRPLRPEGTPEPKRESDPTEDGIPVAVPPNCGTKNRPACRGPGRATATTKQRQEEERMRRVQRRAAAESVAMGSKPKNWGSGLYRPEYNATPIDPHYGATNPG